MNRRALHRVGVTVFIVTGATVVALATPALANDEEGSSDHPPGYEAPATPEIDANSPGLKLGDGATLADARVLDIKFITEDTGGGAQPEDSLENGAGGDAGAGDQEPEGSDVPGNEGESSEEDPGGEQREERTGGQHKFTLQTDVVFGKNSDEISEESRKALAEVAAAIDEYKPTQVNVFGFTDNLGSYENGVTLSSGRAKNTHQVLLDLLESPAGINFNVRGYSEDYPLYDNDTEEGRKKNRRVEISWPSEG